MVAIVFCPDAAGKAALPRVGKWIDIKDQAAHFAEKFAASICEFVVLAVEAVRIQVDHLQKAAGQKLRRKEPGNAREESLFGGTAGSVRDQRLQLDAFCQFGATQKIAVAVGHR